MVIQLSALNFNPWKKHEMLNVKYKVLHRESKFLKQYDSARTN
jgi:hypothetical protein